MKLTIDSGVCTGHGRCYRLASFLDSDDQGYVTPRGVPIEVPADAVAAADEAAGTCPEQAIMLSDE